MISVLPCDAELPSWLAKKHAPFNSEIVLASHNGDGEIQGLLILQETVGMSEVVYLEVVEACRRTGIARRLVEEAQARVTNKSEPSKLCLDVRASNIAACGLYESCGFRHDGRRHDYYGPPEPEDAILMSWQPPPA